MQNYFTTNDYDPKMYATIGGLRSGGIKSGGLMPGGLMSGGLKSAHPTKLDRQPPMVWKGESLVGNCVAQIKFDPFLDLLSFSM